MECKLNGTDQQFIEDLVDLLKNDSPTAEELFWQKLFVGVMRLRSDIVSAPVLQKNVHDLSIKRSLDRLKSKSLSNTK